MLDRQNIQIVSGLIKAISGLAGLFVLYLAFFTYEDEEGAIQDRIENLWISIRDRQERSGKRVAALFQQIAEMLDEFFNRVFGKSLISFQAVCVTMCYSLAGLYLVEPQKDFSTLRITHDSSILGFFAFAFMGTLPAIVGYSKAIVVVAAPLVFSVCIFIAQIGMHLAGNDSYTAKLIAYNMAPLAISFVSDAAAISLLRRLLRSIANTYKIWTLVLALILQGFLAWLIAIPLWLTIKRSPHVSDDVQRVIIVPTAGWNISTGIVAMAFFVLLLCLLVHKISWPLLGRLIYPLARFRITRNRPLMASLALLLITISMPGVGDVLKKIIKLFH